MDGLSLSETRHAEIDRMPPSLTLLLAVAAGLMVASLYYAQPLAGPISRALGMAPGAAGLIVTATQIGYVLGLLLIVPLADLVENRRLVLVINTLGTAALVLAGLSTSAPAFLAAAWLIGLGSVAVQVIVPYVAHLAPERSRGRKVGYIMSGLMLGIMLSRPVSSLTAAALGWHAIFFISAAANVALTVALRLRMPPRTPEPGLRYGKLLLSMATLLTRTPLLQRRSAYQTCLFGSFSLFWTVTPLVLARTFHLGQTGIALFALAGVAGAVVAPLAGRVADRGWLRPGTGVAMTAAAASFLLWHVGNEGSTLALAALVLAAVVLDAGLTGNMVLSQRAIYGLGAEYRARLTGLFLAVFFCGGAAGSALGGWAYAQGGWEAASFAGLVLPVIGLAIYATEFRHRRK